MSSYKVALVGNPNVGKSTIFNSLTGMKQHTGNWTGKTVGNCEGHYKFNNDNFTIVDIPGTYSLMSNSEEEEIARNFICFEKLDAIVIVVDATSLERNLNLVFQIMEITSNIIVCVNLLDEAKKKGKTCLVIDKRSHIAGNVYCENVHGINVHKYGAHIFHTSDKKIWDYVNQFAEFNNYINSPVAVYKDELYNLPFNMNTFSKMWGIRTPEEAKKKIAEQIEELHITEPKNLEEQALSLVGTDVYEKLIKGYTEKQWGRDCKELPAFIIKRLPLRFIYDNNYFNDRYQGILIVECSEEWSKFGYNPCLEQFLHFIREHREVCFLILMPTEKNAKYQEVLFGEFSKNQLWIRQKCETMKIQECMTLFCEDAERSGYSVTEEAKQKLSGLLETRNEMQLDNETLVLQLIRQIQLDKLMQPETEKQIGEEDIRTVSGLPEKEMPRKEIGFRAEIG